MTFRMVGRLSLSWDDDRVGLPLDIDVFVSQRERLAQDAQPVGFRPDKLAAFANPGGLTMTGFRRPLMRAGGVRPRHEVELQFDQIGVGLGGFARAPDRLGGRSRDVTQSSGSDIKTKTPSIAGTEGASKAFGVSLAAAASRSPPRGT